jgi:alpha-tubulin suppressor-like RCC1 family protein
MTTPSNLLFVDFGGGIDAVRLTAGLSHACIIVSNGSVMCWGEGHYGALGYGNTNNVGDTEFPGSAGLVSVPGPIRVITAGGYHTCALKSDNTSLSCWGNNDNGELGYGNTRTIGDDESPAAAGFVQWQALSATPTMTVSSSATPTFTASTTSSVSATQYATVSSTASKTSAASPTSSRSSTVSSSATLTASSTASSAASSQSTLTAVALQIAQVAAGGYHTCILTNNGSVMCWGSNSNGQLGYGHNNSIGDNELPRTAGFVSAGPVSLTMLAAGTSHMCALALNGSVACWGYNAAGELGYGHTNHIGDNELPSSAGYIQLPRGIFVVQIVAGASHTCALASNGSVACWGSNANGELGYGHTNKIGDDEFPSSAGFVRLGVAVTQLGSGTLAYHTCALLVNGSAICWGSNADGALGYGHTNDVGDNEYPSFSGFVKAGVTFASMRAGEHFTCGVTVNGSVKYVSH